MKGSLQTMKSRSAHAGNAAPGTFTIIVSSVRQTGMLVLHDMLK